MTPTKTLLQASPGLAILAISGAFLFLTGCCPKCPPPCPPPCVGCASPTGGGSIAIAISGTVLEQFGASGAVGGSGDIVVYSSGAFQVSTTTSGGNYGPTGAIASTYDGTSTAYQAANRNNSIDELYYNKLIGPDPGPDVSGQSFLLTTPGGGTGAIIPVTITAQKPDGTAHSGVAVKIEDSNFNVVGTGCTTDVNGVCNYTTKLAPNTIYWLYVGSGFPVVHYQFNTAPVDGTQGTLCRLRLFMRY